MTVHGFMYAPQEFVAKQWSLPAWGLRGKEPGKFFKP